MAFDVLIKFLLMKWYRSDIFFFYMIINIFKKFIYGESTFEDRHS